MCEGNAKILRGGMQKLDRVSAGAVWYGNACPVAGLLVHMLSLVSKRYLGILPHAGASTYTHGCKKANTRRTGLLCSVH